MVVYYEIYFDFFQSIKPDNKVDANGRKVEDYWPAAKRVSGVSLLKFFK